MPDLSLLDLGVVDSDVSALRQEVTNESDGCRFTGVAGVCLESEAEDSNVLRGTVVNTLFDSGPKYETDLASDGVEESINNSLGESALLIFVHFHNLPPVCSDLRQVQTLAKVYKVEDVLLEARSTEPNRRAKEFRTDTGVESNSVGDFIDVCTSGFADGREGVDGGDTLREHSVGSELGQFR